MYFYGIIFFGAFGMSVSYKALRYIISQEIDSILTLFVNLFSFRLKRYQSNIIVYPNNSQ